MAIISKIKSMGKGLFTLAQKANTFVENVNSITQGISSVSEQVHDIIGPYISNEDKNKFKEIDSIKNIPESSKVEQKHTRAPSKLESENAQTWLQQYWLPILLVSICLINVVVFVILRRTSKQNKTINVNKISNEYEFQKRTGNKRNTKVSTTKKIGKPKKRFRIKRNI